MVIIIHSISTENPIFIRYFQSYYHTMTIHLSTCHQTNSIPLKYVNFIFMYNNLLGIQIRILYRLIVYQINKYSCMIYLELNKFPYKYFEISHIFRKFWHKNEKFVVFNSFISYSSILSFFKS